MCWSLCWLRPEITTSRDENQIFCNAQFTLPEYEIADRALYCPEIMDFTLHTAHHRCCFLHTCNSASAILKIEMYLSPVSWDKSYFYHVSQQHIYVIKFQYTTLTIIEEDKILKFNIHICFVYTLNSFKLLSNTLSKK